MFELNGLRGKNRAAIEQMARRIRVERNEFDHSLRKLQALRAVFGRHQQAIYATARHRPAQAPRARRPQPDAREQAVVGLREGMSSLTESVRGDFDRLSPACADEVQTLMTAMYGSFNREHGLTLGSPLPFTTRRFVSLIESRPCSSATSAHSAS